MEARRSGLPHSLEEKENGERGKKGDREERNEREGQRAGGREEGRRILSRNTVGQYKELTCKPRDTEALHRAFAWVPPPCHASSAGVLFFCKRLRATVLPLAS